MLIGQMTIPAREVDRFEPVRRRSGIRRLIGSVRFSFWIQNIIVVGRSIPLQLWIRVYIAPAERAGANAEVAVMLGQLDKLFIKSFILIAMIAFVGEAIAANL